MIAGCSQRGDVRVISSKLLPRPVRMSKGSLLVKIAGKTKPGKYAIALRCEDKNNQPDSVDVKTVRIYKVPGGALAREDSGPLRVARTLALSRATRGPYLEPPRPSLSSPSPRTSPQPPHAAEAMRG